MWQCYSSSSSLFFGNEQISSEVGAQQGDPCGPMAFSLCIHPIIEMLASELNIWYLDDGTLGGEPDAVLNDFEMLQPNVNYSSATTRINQYMTNSLQSHQVLK